MGTQPTLVLGVQHKLDREKDRWLDKSFLRQAEVNLAGLGNYLLQIVVSIKKSVNTTF